VRGVPDRGLGSQSRGDRSGAGSPVLSSPDTATADDIRRFQLHLAESGISICNRNRIMTGVRFLFRVTLRRHDLAAEIYHLKEPEKLPLTRSCRSP
jgi:site-specific recombinase XerD